MERIKYYLISNLQDLEFIGDLRKENGFYYFSANSIEDLEVDFENRIYEVVKIDYSSIGCYLTLKVEVSFLESAAEISEG